MKNKLNVCCLWLLIIVANCASCSPATHYPFATSEATSIPSTSQPIVTTAVTTATLSYIQISPEKIFAGWLQGNSGCDLPCWAGITPGQTKWDDAISSMSKLVTPHIGAPVLCRYGPCKYFDWQFEFRGGLFSGIMYERNDFVYAIYLNSEKTSELSLQKILVKYKQPDLVLLSASSFTFEGSPTINLILLYKDNSFVIRYMWWAEFAGDEISSCGDPYIVYLGVVAVENDGWTEIEITQMGRQTRANATSENFKPINEVTRLSEAEFYQLGLQPVEKFCISTSVSYWQ